MTMAPQENHSQRVVPIPDGGWVCPILRFSASSRSMKTSTRSIFGMSRLVSLTRKRFASGRFRSCDEWMFGVNFRQAGYTATWIDQSIWLDAVSFRTIRPPREVDRAYSQEGMSKAGNLNPSHRKVCLTSRLFLYRGRHLSRSCPRLKRLERRTKSRPIFRQHVFHLGWHFRIYLAMNYAIFSQVT
jgi:hypothetical protein